MNRPDTATTSSRPFPPRADDVPFDEEGAFVGQKEKNWGPEDPPRGGGWDHAALDPEGRLVVSLVAGKRTEGATHARVGDFHQRTGGRVMRLMTADEYPVHASATRETYGQKVTPPRAGRRGRPRNPPAVVPPEVTYATVHKERENSRVVDVSTRVAPGTAMAVVASAVSSVANTWFVARHNGTDRSRCRRKVRKTYGFPEGGEVHRAATAFRYFSHNLCGPVRTRRTRGESGHGCHRTPAMAAVLTDHVWPVTEWLTSPAVQRK